MCPVPREAPGLTTVPAVLSLSRLPHRPPHWPVPTPTHPRLPHLAPIIPAAAAAAAAATKLSCCLYLEDPSASPQPCCLLPQPPSWGPSSLHGPCCLSPRARPRTTPGRSLGPFQLEFQKPFSEGLCLWISWILLLTQHSQDLPQHLPFSGPQVCPPCCKTSVSCRTPLLPTSSTSVLCPLSLPINPDPSFPTPMEPEREPRPELAW